MKVVSMYFLRRRALPGLLAIICLLAGTILPIPLPGMGGRALAAAGPDLAIQSITWSPGQPSIGERVYFNVTIANNGDTIASNFRLLFYIDHDITDSAQISQVEAGSTVNYIFTWMAVTGAHTVKMVADSDSTVTEINENNNELSYAFSVLAPDLLIETVTWAPEKPSSGNTVTFNLTVRNAGDRLAATFWVDFIIDNASRGQREAHTLNPGATLTIPYTWTALAGQHTLEARIDVLNQCTESNEANNTLTTYYCTTPPDLMIDSLTWTPQDRTETGNVTMSVKVKNRGEGASYGAWLYYYIDNTLQKSVFINSLDAGAATTDTYNWQPGPDARTVRAVIDPDNWIFESDEANNDRSVTLPSLGLPDLTIQNIEWTPQTPQANTRMTFIVTVKNTGFRAVEKCDVVLYITGGVRLTRQPGPIAAGASVNATMQYMTSETSVNIRAVLDETNNIAELDEANNEMNFSLTPQLPVPVADLAVESITCTPSNPADGDYVVIKAVFKNQGPGISDASYAACYIDNDMIGDMYFGKLNSGATVERTIRWKAVSGEHLVKLSLDYNDAVFETNETNNEATAALITADPDLAVEKIEWFPTYPEIGDDVSFTVTVKNQGNRASGACFLTYYIDGVKQGEHYIDGIEAGASLARIFYWDMQAASHNFLVTIDELDTVTESNEANNDRSLLIPGPDLIVRSITCSDDYPVADSTLSFIITIANTGRSAAGISSMAGYIDGNPLAMVETGELNTGESFESVLFWTAEPGKHTLRIITDEGNSVTESDEANNAKEVIIFVPMAALPAAPADAIPVRDNETMDTGNATIIPPETIAAGPAATEPFIEDLFKDLENLENTGTAENATEDISGNLSATDEPGGGITGLLTNKWLLIGVGVVGVAAIGILLVLRKRSGQPKKEKAPKPPKPAKPAKAPPPKAAPGKTSLTLSGKPPVLVPPPSKTGAPVKVIVPPDARQGLGASLIKQGNQTPPKPPAVPPPAAPPPPK